MDRPYFVNWKLSYNLYNSTKHRKKTVRKEEETWRNLLWWKWREEGFDALAMFIVCNLWLRLITISRCSSKVGQRARIIVSERILGNHDLKFFVVTRFKWIHLVQQERPQLDLNTMTVTEIMVLNWNWCGTMLGSWSTKFCLQYSYGNTFNQIGKHDFSRMRQFSAIRKIRFRAPAL